MARGDERRTIVRDAWEDIGGRGRIGEGRTMDRLPGQAWRLGLRSSNVPGTSELRPDAGENTRASARLELYRRLASSKESCRVTPHERHFAPPVARKDYPRSYPEFLEWSANGDACRRYLRRCRWPKGFICARRGERAEPWTTARGHLHSRRCGCEVSATAGTICEGTWTSLRTGFSAMGLVTSQKDGANVLTPFHPQPSSEGNYVKWISPLIKIFAP